MTQVAAQRTHVVVVGGGYAGTLAANHLRQCPDIDITVVNPRPVFVERIRVHQLVADTGAATADYGSLLGDGIRLVVDTVDRIAAGDRCAQLGSGTGLDYDYLVYAVGSTGATPLTVPGAAEFAYSVSDLESAQRLRYALADLPPAAPVAVVGGGLTGIETASELAERGRPGDPDLRGRPRPVVERPGPTFGGQAAAPSRRRRPGPRRRDRSALERGGAHRRHLGAQRGDGVDGGVCRAGSGRTQRAEHRRPGAASRR